MQTRPSLLFVLFGIGCALMLGACGPQVKNLHRDESFTGASVRSGNLYIGGVTYALNNENDPDEARSSLTEQLYVEVSEHINKYQLPRTNLLSLVLDYPTYAGMLDYYEKNGVLVTRRARSESGIRRQRALIVLGRVERDEHWNNRRRLRTRLAQNWLPIIAPAGDCA